MLTIAAFFISGRAACFRYSGDGRRAAERFLSETGPPDNNEYLAFCEAENPKLRVS